MNWLERIRQRFEPPVRRPGKLKIPPDIVLEIKKMAKDYEDGENREYRLMVAIGLEAIRRLNDQGGE